MKLQGGFFNFGFFFHWLRPKKISFSGYMRGGDIFFQLDTMRSCSERRVFTDGHSERAKNNGGLFVCTVNGAEAMSRLGATSPVFWGQSLFRILRDFDQISRGYEYHVHKTCFCIATIKYPSLSAWKKSLWVAVFSKYLQPA